MAHPALKAAILLKLAFRQGWLSAVLKASALVALTACISINRVEEVKFITTDFDNFWEAFTAVPPDTAQAAALFQQRYFAAGSPGLQEYYQNRY